MKSSYIYTRQDILNILVTTTNVDRSKKVVIPTPKTQHNPALAKAPLQEDRRCYNETIYESSFS